MVLSVFLFISCTNALGQTAHKQDCKIEFFLLKSIKPNLDTAVKLSAPFSVDLTDLADTAFIKDHEILRYTFKKDTVKTKDSSHIYTRQMFELAPGVAKRVNSLKIPLCCGRQFALVINGNIVYSGYFWNMISSWGCSGITAFVYEGRIEMLRRLPDLDFSIDSEDPRKNKLILDCLNKTHRVVGTD